MSLKKTRTGPEKVRRAFSGLGQADQVDISLGREGITPTMFNQVVANPLVTQRVVAAIKGEAPRVLTLDALIEREQQFARNFCALAEMEYVGDNVVENALVRAQEVWGQLTEHDRFMPEIGLPEGFQSHYSWNAGREAEGLSCLKLCHNPNSEWWRTDAQVEHLRTTVGVIRCNFATVMEWSDLDGRPFNLSREKQIAWAGEQGGNGITTAEQNVYLNVRSLMERSLPLISLGSLRCQNRCGSAHSLRVRCHAVYGFLVGRWHGGHARWPLGALPGKFVALGN
ncbi:MAG: hypothetical protein WAP74_01450 [Patescibacteria group bacterium]